MQLASRRILILVAVVPILALALVACGELLGRSEGELAADFAIMPYHDDPILGEGEVLFSEVLETTDLPVVLNFWAADCPPCRAEMPLFQQVADERDGDVLFMGVDVGLFTGLGSHDGGRRLLADLGIRYPTGYAVDASPVRDYEIRSMPTTLFISPDGFVQEQVVGQISERHLRETLDDLV